MIIDKKGKYGKEWAEDIMKRLQTPKGFRKPSKVEVDHAINILMKEGMIVNTSKPKKGILDRLFPKIGK